MTKDPTASTRRKKFTNVCELIGTPERCKFEGDKGYRYCHPVSAGRMLVVHVGG